MVELIVYQSLGRLLSVRLSTFSYILSSETNGLIQLKFHMEIPYDAGMTVCSNGSGHMTKMDATPIYGENLLKMFFSRTRRLMMDLVCSIGDVGPTRFVQIMTY